MPDFDELVLVFFDTIIQHWPLDIEAYVTDNKQMDKLYSCFM